MSDNDVTVFISYRRASSAFIALAVFKDLRNHGYDVFMDVESLDSGTFDTMLLNQIASRTHFVLILAQGTVERCADANDWLRFEIEHALETERTIVPLFINNFSFDGSETYLTGKLETLKRYNGINVPIDFFDEAMERLRTRFLKAKAQGGSGLIGSLQKHKLAPVKQSISTAEQQFVRERIEEIESQPAPTKAELTAEYCFGLGYGMQKAGDLGGAITYYDEAIRINPEYRRAYYNRGLAYHQMKELMRAESDYLQVLKLDPEYIKAHHNLGLIEYQHGNYAKAITRLNRAIELEPMYAIAYLNRGRARKANHEHEAAAADFEHYIQFFPGNTHEEIKTSVAALESGDTEYADMTHPLEPKAQATYKIAAVRPEEPARPGAIGLQTKRGNLGKNYQDACVYLYSSTRADNSVPYFGCFVICEGFGAESAKAASTALSLVSGDLVKMLVLPVAEDGLSFQETRIEKSIHDAIQHANEVVRQIGAESGCSVTAGVMHGIKISIGHVGSTGAFLVESDDIQQLTEVHSFVEALVAAGHMTREQASDHPMGDVLYRALGQDDTVDVDLRTETFSNGAKLVLCTKGLYVWVSTQEIQRIVLRSAPQDAADQLIELARQRGDYANITVLIV